MHTTTTVTTLPKTMGELVSQNNPHLQNIIPSFRDIPSDATCVSIIGSTKFYGAKSEAICQAIGNKIAKLNIVLFTGSMKAVQETVAKAAISQQFEPKRIHHLAPGGEDGKNPGVWRDEAKYGCWHEVGDCFEKRREALARTSYLHILVEGGPGACHEANEVLAAGGVVLPIVCSGGAAGRMSYNVPQASMKSVDFSRAEKAMQQILTEEDCKILFDKDADVDALATVIEKAIQNVKARSSA